MQGIVAIAGLMFGFFVISPWMDGCQKRQAAMVQSCVKTCAPNLVEYASENECTCSSSYKKKRK